MYKCMYKCMYVCINECIYKFCFTLCLVNWQPSRPARFRQFQFRNVRRIHLKLVFTIRDTSFAHHAIKAQGRVHAMVLSFLYINASFPHPSHTHHCLHSPSSSPAKCVHVSTYRSRDHEIPLRLRAVVRGVQERPEGGAGDPCQQRRATPTSAKRNQRYSLHPQRLQDWKKYVRIGM